MDQMTQAAEEAVRTDVWVSDIFWSPVVAWTKFTCDLYEQDEKKALALIEATRRGEAVPPNDFPSMMRSTSLKQDLKETKHVFRANDLDVVSGTFAEVLRRHDIGETRLFPVTLLKADRKAPYEGEFFVLNVREKKRAFDPDASRHFKTRRNEQKGQKGTMPLTLSHGDITVTTEALDGPDLWLDPSLFRSMFFKGALAREVVDRKLMPSTRTESESIARCVVTRSA